MASIPDLADIERRTLATERLLGALIARLSARDPRPLQELQAVFDRILRWVRAGVGLGRDLVPGGRRKSWLYMGSLGSNCRTSLSPRQSLRT